MKMLTVLIVFINVMWCSTLELYLIQSLSSYHFDREAGYNESHDATGFLIKKDNLTVQYMEFTNSYYDATTTINVGIESDSYANFKLKAGVVYQQGYNMPHVLPTLTVVYEYGPLRLEIIPPVSELGVICLYWKVI